MLGVYEVSCLPGSFASTGEMFFEISPHDMGHAESSWLLMLSVTSVAILISSFITSSHLKSL